MHRVMSTALAGGLVAMLLTLGCEQPQTTKAPAAQAEAEAVAPATTEAPAPPTTKEPAAAPATSPSAPAAPVSGALSSEPSQAKPFEGSKVALLHTVNLVGELEPCG